MSDLISREALIADIKRVYCTGCNDYHGVRCRACGTGDALDMVDDAPSVDAEPVRHGRWIVQDDTFTRFICSECGTNNQDGVGNYCPYCGAKMDEEG